MAVFLPQADRFYLPLAVGGSAPTEAIPPTTFPQDSTPLLRILIISGDAARPFSALTYFSGRYKMTTTRFLTT
jgi:hypothetical protein